jgi:ribosomal protein S18 acetylase RimI-like enzyme
VSTTRDAWLSERFGYPVYTVDADTDAKTVGEALRDDAPAFYQARVGADRVDRIRLLVAAGMYPVDVTLTLGRAPGDAGEADPAIVEAGPEHREETLALARSAFRYSRFHLDPLVPDSIADEIKRAWVESYFEGRRGERLLVALRDGSVAGFLAVLAGREDGVETRVIDLVAVAPEARGTGVGSALSRTFASAARDACDALRVGTQAANVPALRLYERLGFTTVSTAYVLHGHAGR